MGKIEEHMTVVCKNQQFLRMCGSDSPKFSKVVMTTFVNCP